jgi:exodeoxyribonuclease V alpha subunit
MSRRQGDVDTPGYNTTYANALLRAVCNPHAPKVPGTALHVGDRIIIRDNMTIEQPADPKRPDAPVLSVDVVNGDTGTIKGFDLDEKDQRNGAARWLRLTLDDGRAIKFPGSAANALAHAYALTVHAGQGSEYPEVNRNMLFTGLSRARENLRIFGEDKVLMRIAATPLPPRNSALVERVLAELAGENEEAAERKGERERERRAA